MCRIDNSGWISTSLVSTALLIGSGALCSQPPSQKPLEGLQPLQSATIPIPEPSHEAVGDSMMAHRRYQAAIEAYKQAPQNSANVWNKLGIANQMLFNLPEATRCYQASLKLDSKNVNVLNNLGTVYDSQKDYKAAVRMYHKALKIDPKSPLVLKNLGTDLLAQHKYEKGWEVYKQALAMDPQIFDNNMGPRVENPASVQQRGAMNYYMAKGCVRAGRNDRAIEYLRMAINEGFTNPRKLAIDNEFASLRSIPAFQQLISEQNSQ